MSFSAEAFCENHKKNSVEKSPLDLQFTESYKDLFGPALPPHFSVISSESKEKERIFGPSLPDHFIEKKKDNWSGETSSIVLEENSNILIGPDIPKHLTPKLTTQEVEKVSVPAFIEDVYFGPSTSLMATEDVIGCYKFLNTQNLPKKQTEIITKSDIKRELWMTELPQKKKGKFGFLHRNFKPQIQTQKESDESVWTDTPDNKKKKEIDINKKDHNEILKAKRLEERDKEMEKLVKKAAKRFKKEKSLLEIHLKRMKNKKKKESKKQKKEKILLPERRPFDRTVDLQIINYDKSQKKAILNKGQFLHDRFAPGQSKFL